MFISVPKLDIFNMGVIGNFWRQLVDVGETAALGTFLIITFSHCRRLISCRTNRRLTCKSPEMERFTSDISELQP